MTNLFDEMPSLKELHDQIESMKLLSILGRDEVKHDIDNLETRLASLVHNLEKYIEIFSDNGWIIYDSIDGRLVERAVNTYTEFGFEVAEEVLIKYYSSDIYDFMDQLRNGSCELALRFHLIEQAFQDHKDKRYHASVPLFLMIIDGAVNDYTKRQGFFSEGTELDVWDCLVGCGDGLNRMKKVYCLSRTKTSSDPIYLPYRNGILHGRDLNYANQYVSCKCIVLLYAIRDWMNFKGSEAQRMQKLADSQKPIDLIELGEQIQRNKRDKLKISEWRPTVINIGVDVPESGESCVYKNYAYLQRVVEMFEIWKARNYGELAKRLNYIFRYEPNENLRPKACRELFAKKEIISFAFREIDDHAIALKRVLVEVNWKTDSSIFNGMMEFNIVYQSSDYKARYPWNDQY